MSFAPAMFVPDSVIDVTRDVCPMTYVRTRLALDRLATGQLLEVRLRGAEPAQSVPRSAIRHGHLIVQRRTGSDGGVTLLIRKGPAAVFTAAKPG